MKILSLFSGIGAFEKALSNLKVSFSLVNYCEIDKYASKAYSIIHGVDESKNLGDITKVNVDTLPDFDLMTWGFPCQDISVAGKQSGIEIGTRSGLYYEGLRILKAKLPKYSIIENVKNLTGKKFKAQFDSILQDLEQLGYTNYWKVLNAKDYGIPQNRERVFIISIRGDHKPYEFPQPFYNGLRLKDMLQDSVDEKYYISDEKASKVLLHLKELTGNTITISKQARKFEKNIDIATCLLARDYKGFGNQEMNAVVESNVLRYERTKHKKSIRKQYESGEIDKKIGNMRKPMFTSTGQDRHGIVQIGTFDKEDINDNERQRRVYDEQGTSPSILARQDSPKVLQKIGSIGTDSQANRVYSTDGIATAQCGEAGGLGAKTGLYYTDYRIRKLTPKECWRLMGFDDTDIDKCIDAGISNTNLYKMAGNSIVVNVLQKIFKQLV